MILKNDTQFEELLAKGGTFDLTGTTAVTDKQFWGFNASDGAVLNVLKGVPANAGYADLAAITAAEVDLLPLLLTTGTDPLFAGTPYRVKGYIITNVDLTSGSLHLFKIKNQMPAEE